MSNRDGLSNVCDNAISKLSSSNDKTIKLNSNEKLLDDSNNDNGSRNSSIGIDLPSQYALRVALQTMKERCIALQQRLLIVEEENAILRNKSITITDKNSDLTSNKNNNDIQQKITQKSNNSGTMGKDLEIILRKQIDEIIQQKLQLTEHIAMVSNENRQLWTYLSQLAKNDTKTTKPKQQKQEEQQQNQKESDYSKNGGQNNLIRSRTFTQNSPNPILRQKYLAIGSLGTNAINKSGLNDKSLDDLSLEEISLKDIDGNDDDIDGVRNDRDNIDNAIKGNTVDIGRNQIRKKSWTTDNNTLGFGYLNDDLSNNSSINDGGTMTGAELAATAATLTDSVDLGNDTKKCIDGILDIKSKVLQQQNELKCLFNILKEKKELPQEECIECKQRLMNKPQMIDKTIETDESLQVINNIKPKIMSDNIFCNSFSTTSTTSTNNSNNNLGIIDTSNNHRNDSSRHINILEEKRRADELCKICPMCGKIYDENILFDDFQEHVETHFIDDTSIDPSTIERNFELINTIGNF